LSTIIFYKTIDFIYIQQKQTFIILDYEFWVTPDQIPKYITRWKYEYIASIFQGMEHVCFEGRGVMVCVYAVKRQIT